MNVTLPAPLIAWGGRSRRREGLARMLTRIAVVAACLAGAALASDAQDWARTEVVALVLLMVLAGEFHNVQVGAARFNIQTVTVVVTAAVLGPLPAVLAGLLSCVIDARYRRVALQSFLSNASVFAAFSAFAGLAFELARDLGAADPGSALVPLLVLALVPVVEGLNFVHLVLDAPPFSAVPIRRSLRRTFLPVTPWMAVSAGLGAGAVHAYFTLGSGALVVLLCLLVTIQALLTTIERELQQQQEIVRIGEERSRYLQESLEAGDRERRRIAAELHDDALQTILTARQDLAEEPSAPDRADERLALAVTQIRRLAARLHEDGASDVPLEPALVRRADELRARWGTAIEVRVAPALRRLPDERAFAIAAELMTNAAKHSGAAAAWLDVRLDGDRLLIEMRDHGEGFDPERPRSLDEHLGLALVERRAAAQGGDVEVRSRLGAGTTVRVDIPWQGGPGHASAIAPGAKRPQARKRP